MRSIFKVTLCAIVLAGLGAAASHAEKMPPNQLLRFSGALKDGNGQPLTGQQILVFEIFDAARGGEPLWREKHQVTMEDGAYSVLLGSKNRIDIPLDRDYYLFVHPQGLDASLEQYRIAVAVDAPGSLPGTLPAERGVYRFDVYTHKAAKGKAADLSDDAPRAAQAPPADTAPEPVAEDATVSAKGLKLRTVKQVQSPGGTLATNPPAGTPDPLQLPGVGLLQLDVNPAAVQTRVNGTCAVGSAIASIASDGTVTCVSAGTGATGPTGPSGPQGIQGPIGPTGPSAYSAGAGLSLVGTVFSVDPAQTQTRVGTSCPPGQAIRAIDAGGNVTCDPLIGRVVDRIVGNIFAPANPPGGYLNIVSNYIPPVNATAFVWVRCSYDTMGTITWNMRAAIRTPTGGALTIGNAFYMGSTSSGTGDSVFNMVYDAFDLVGGTSYDFGVNFFTPPNPSGSISPFCSILVQLVSR